MITIDIINDVTIVELRDTNNNPVSYTSGQTIVLTDFYDESEIEAADSLQTAVDNGDVNMFVNGVSTTDYESDPFAQYTTQQEARDAAPIQSVSGAAVDNTDPENPVIDGAANGYTIFHATWEENGGLANNNRQWSMGNGATGQVNLPPLPFDCEIFAISFHAEVGGTTVSFNIFENNSIVSTSSNLSGSSGLQMFTTPIDAPAGSIWGVGTLLEVGSYVDARVSLWFRVRATSLSNSLINDLLDVSIDGIVANQILQFNGTSFVPSNLDPTAVGLSNVDNTSDANKPISNATQSALDQKLESTDIQNFETSSELDARDNANRNRANHSGTQTASTISDFNTAVENNSSVTANTAKRSYPIGDESKLAGIEANAEVNQDDSEIKTQYENNSNTNAFTDAEKAKLASLESSKFLGEFPSLAALQLAFPSPAAGSYANVDTGIGNDVERYIWDSGDSQYILQLGESTSLTDAQIKTQYENNADTNAFTDTEKSKLGAIEANAKDDQNANEVPYNNGGTSLTSNELQGAVNELSTKIDSNEGDISSLNSAVNNNTSANSGSVTVHSDVNNAGSGSIITDEERRILTGRASFGSNSTIDANQVTPAIIVMNTPLDNNKPGLVIGPNGGLLIPANYAGHWAAEYKFTYDFTNRSNISGGIDVNNTGTILDQSISPTYNTRNAANPNGSVVSGWVPLGSLAVGDEVILKSFRTGTQTGVVPLNPGQTVLTLHYLGL